MTTKDMTLFVHHRQTNRYGASTLNGPWMEERYRRDEDLEDFMFRVILDQPNLQLAEAAREDLLVPVQLLPAVNNLVWFGDQLQLAYVGGNFHTAPFCFEPPDVVISADVFTPCCRFPLTTPTSISVSIQLQPAIRNVFTVTHPRGGDERRPLTFGEPFCLRLDQGCDQQLYLTNSVTYSDINPSRVDVQLSNCKSRSWMVLSAGGKAVCRRQPLGGAVPIDAPLALCSYPGARMFVLQRAHNLLSLREDFHVTAKICRDGQPCPQSGHHWAFRARTIDR